MIIIKLNLLMDRNRKGMKYKRRCRFGKDLGKMCVSFELEMIFR